MNEARHSHDMSSGSSWFLRRGSLLILGFLLLLISNMRGSAGLFAWFMPVPFLVYSVRNHGLKNDLWLLLILIAGSVLSFIKAISDPLFISIGFSIMIGIVIGLRYFIALLLWKYVRKWGGDRIGSAAFPAIVVSLEYLQASYTPFGDWGSMANTQLYDLPFLQTASLFGFLGISAMMAWAAVLCSSVLLKGSPARSGTRLSLFIVVLATLYIYGDLRLNKVPQGKHILSAAIMGDFQFTGVIPDPESPEVRRATETLIDRTRTAARRGASIAVWGEGSTVTSDQGELRLLEKLSAVAVENDIAIVASYAVTVAEDSEAEYGFINKFSWISNKGEIAETYLKHHPVPGEGSKKGSSPLRVIHTDFGELSGAICYDYDFPQMALSQARLGADMVVVAGLDWRGVLTRHTLMSRIRAIEGGFSVLRSANEATSMGFDNYGQIRAAMTDFGDNDRILIASLPVQQIDTLYTRVGNSIAYVALLFVILSFLISASNHRRNKQLEL